jgi:hypothetical protein
MFFTNCKCLFKTTAHPPNHIRLFLGVVFFLITNITFSQSKKEQIEELTRQKDSLVAVLNQKDSEIQQLHRQHAEMGEKQKELQLQNQSLNKDLQTKEKELDELKNQLSLPKKCLAAQMETNVLINDSGEDPTLEKKAIFNGIELVQTQEGENTSYPNRLYGFQYSIVGIEDNFPSGILLNEKRPELENKLNDMARTELLKQGVSKAQIVPYFFSNKLYDDSEGKINFFIEFDQVTFYFEQFMYEQVYDRLEITFPLEEIAPYLINAENWSSEEKRKFVSSFNNTSPITTNGSNAETRKNGVLHCVETENPNVENELSFLQVNTCTYLNFKFIDSLYGDCVYPDCFKFSFFKLVNNQYVEIQLYELFNDKIALLEQEINRRCLLELKKFQNPKSGEYDNTYKSSVYKNHAFKGIKNQWGEYSQLIDFFSINEEGISFRTFVEFDKLNGEFKRDDGWLFATFTFEEITPYLSK